jgi:hypothetical protein
MEGNSFIKRGTHVVLSPFLLLLQRSIATFIERKADRHFVDKASFTFQAMCPLSCRQHLAQCVGLNEARANLKAINSMFSSLPSLLLALAFGTSS